MLKFEVISQKVGKQPKKCIVLGNQDFKIPDCEFLLEYLYSNTLEDTKEKILGSYQPKLMSKTEVLSQKFRIQPKMS